MRKSDRNRWGASDGLLKQVLWQLLLMQNKSFSLKNSSLSQVVLQEALSGLPVGKGIFGRDEVLAMTGIIDQEITCKERFRWNGRAQEIGRGT